MTTVSPVAVPKIAPAPSPAAPAGGEDYNGPSIVNDRAGRGRIAENTADVLPADVVERGAPNYFRTYEQLKQGMFDLQAQFPDLVEIKDIGDSYEKTQGKADRDILAMVLTDHNTSGPKVAAQHIAGVHAREIANPEMLMTFGKQLLEGFGRDPEATALLKTREIRLVPMVNPDGHAMVERGFAGTANGNLMKRKNTSGNGGEGTDVNRNFEFHWGGPGASSSPRSETYRGPSASSEPETKAVQEFTKSEGGQKPNMFIDWHSYSKLNMYPWGDTRAKTPDHEGFKAVAEKMSTMNHYSPIQSVDLYPTTGTTDDTAYGAYGVPALAVETGDSFHQSDSEFANTLRDNLPVLTYTTKIADDPFARVKGPDALEVLVDPTTRQVTARVSDDASGNQVIAGAELVLDPNTPAGKGVALTAADGTFNGSTESVTGNIKKVPGLGKGAGDGTLVYVRAKDAEGNWGPLTAQWLTGPAAAKGAAAAATADAAK